LNKKNHENLEDWERPINKDDDDDFRFSLSKIHKKRYFTSTQQFYFMSMNLTLKKRRRRKHKGLQNFILPSKFVVVISSNKLL
jgi:hypothetical protein